MPTSTTPASTAPRDAATLVILRDGLRGLEVFLVRRHSQSAVLGGAHVFPGGKLDASDLLLDPTAHLDQTPAQLHAALGEQALTTQHACGLYVAALREAFEECGVLFAQGAHRLASARLAHSIQRGQPFNQALADAAGGPLRLQTQAIHPWSRWITPRTPLVSARRFDTRFFVAALPDGQQASHDNVETTESVWLAPRAALEQYRDQHLQMAPPQIMTLAHLARFADVASVLQAARQTPPPLIAPEPLEVQGERVLCYPGDAGHSVARRAMPGPTRLHYRQQRFEPAEGFAAWLAELPPTATSSHGGGL